MSDPGVVNCATNGHLWHYGKCVMCGQPRPPDTPEPLKICRDCKWCRWPHASSSSCTHARALEPMVDLVTGREIGPWLHCLTMRTVAGGPCGIEARLFEAREAKP